MLAIPFRCITFARFKDVTLWTEGHNNNNNNNNNLQWYHVNVRLCTLTISLFSQGISKSHSLTYLKLILTSNI